MIKVALVDDQMLFRKGMKALVDSFKGIHVVLEAGSGLELLEELNDPTNKVDVVLLDISMPELNGLQTLEKLKFQFPSLKNIMLSVHDQEKYIVKLIDAGANAYLAKNSEPEKVEIAIRTVYDRDFFFDQQTLQAMQNGFRYNKSKIVLEPKNLLTNREKEVLGLICQEYTTADIANQLFLSERTVEGHRNKIMQKTGCRNTAGIVVFAIKYDLYDVFI